VLNGVDTHMVFNFITITTLSQGAGQTRPSLTGKVSAGNAINAYSCHGIPAGGFQCRARYSNNHECLTGRATTLAWGSTQHILRALVSMVCIHNPFSTFSFIPCFTVFVARKVSDFFSISSDVTDICNLLNSSIVLVHWPRLFFRTQLYCCTHQLMYTTYLLILNL